MAKVLSEGDKAPAFTLNADGGGTVSLGDFAGKALVLFLYPKDDTSGCTKEAIGFSENAAAFKKADAAILGVSKDTVASHDKFKKKYVLNVPLGADPETKMIGDYQSWVEKTLYGRKYMGTDRATFLIDGKGVIRKIWRKVKVPGHVEAVLAAVKEMQ